MNAGIFLQKNTCFNLLRMLIVGGDATDGANKDTKDAVDGGEHPDAKIEQVTTQKLGTQVSVYQPPPPNMLVGVGEKDLPQLEGVYIQFKVSRFKSGKIKRMARLLLSSGPINY